MAPFLLFTAETALPPLHSFRRPQTGKTVRTARARPPIYATASVLYYGCDEDTPNHQPATVAKQPTPDDQATSRLAFWEQSRAPSTQPPRHENDHPAQRHSGPAKLPAWPPKQVSPPPRQDTDGRETAIRPELRNTARSFAYRRRHQQWFARLRPGKTTASTVSPVSFESLRSQTGRPH